MASSPQQVVKKWVKALWQEGTAKKPRLNTQVIPRGWVNKEHYKVFWPRHNSKSAMDNYSAPTNNWAVYRLMGCSKTT
jgi:hypothetical protein